MSVRLGKAVLCSYFPQMLMSITYEYWSSGKTEGHVVCSSMDLLGRYRSETNKAKNYQCHRHCT
jgi:hypothetical protein